MQRIGNLLDDFNKEIVKTLGIHQAWEEIAGEVLAAHTEPVHLKSGTLLVVCDAPLWAQQVGILNANLCQQIKKVTGLRVKGCEGRFGRMRKSVPLARKKASPVKPAIDPQIVANIKNPELREHVLALLAIKDGPVDE